MTAGADRVRSGRPLVLRLAPAPRTEPPAEGADWDQAPVASTRRPYVQGTLAVDFRDAAEDQFFGPQATSTPDLPPAQTWARRMVQAVLEAQVGTRSADQLSRWVLPSIKEAAARRGTLARRRGLGTHRPPVVRSLRVSHPADGVCEIAAVVWLEGRVRALALRMSGVDGRWLITAWELG